MEAFSFTDLKHNQCKFTDANGNRCTELTRTISHNEELHIDTKNPNGSGSYFSAWHSHNECEELCFYHKQIMEGMICPAYSSLIPRELRRDVEKKRTAYLQSFIEKKIEINGWNRRNY